MTTAAIAPTAARYGANNVPITPRVTGISRIDSSFSFLMIILLAFPSSRTSLTFLTKSSPVSLNSSFLVEVVFFYYPGALASYKKEDPGCDELI